MNAIEEWRPVVGSEGIYEVSSMGNVRSIDREVWHGTGTRNGTRRLTGRTLAVVIVKEYPSVSIGRKLVYIHKLVCEAWHGARPEGMECRHLDGNPLNSVPENLAWGTHSENMRDCITHGRHYLRNRTHCVNGHEFTPANTYRHEGRRHCRSCNRIAVAKSKVRREQVAA